MKHQITHRNLTIEELALTKELFKKNINTLTKYSELLLWWNKKINLVSRAVSHETLIEHIFHSLFLSPFINELKPELIIDTGTGGGLPGIPLAISFSEIPVVLNDIGSKKIIANKNMASDLGLKNTIGLTGSIEGVEINCRDLIISKHAFKINSLLRLVSEKPWQRILLLKGKEEVAQELGGVTEVLGVEVVELEKVLENKFYTGKAVVKIERIYEEF